MSIHTFGGLVRARQPFPSWLLTGLEKLASIVVVQKPWPMLCSLYFFLILFLFLFLLVPYFFPICLFSSFLLFSYVFSTFIILMISKKCWLLNDMGLHQNFLHKFSCAFCPCPWPKEMKCKRSCRLVTSNDCFGCQSVPF